MCSHCAASRPSAAVLEALEEIARQVAAQYAARFRVWLEIAELVKDEFRPKPADVCRY
jgi:hypothetical protein